MSEPKKTQKKSLLSVLSIMAVAVLLLIGQQLGLVPETNQDSSNFTVIEQTTATPTAEPTATPKTETPTPSPADSGRGQATVITEPQALVNYLAAHNGELPDNFITKAEAQALGWDSSRNKVSDVAPGKSIGGDRFGNYEGLLPKASGRTYREADCYYSKGARNGCRLVWSNDGLYFYTDDHYETFTEMFPD